MHLFSSNGLNIIETEYFKSSDEHLKKAFKNFLKQPETYKKEFLQAHYNCAFDGYSFLGQKNSLNQYETDLLHSFVLSEFSDVKAFPKEFHSFLNNDWSALTTRVKQIELELIAQLQIADLKSFYNTTIGHMVSCNYYPPIPNNISAPTRLSKHTDVSLFTVFVFGATNGFSYQNHLNKKKALKITDNIVVFPGYLLEFLTAGKYKALEHEVDFYENDKERFSYAFFSIPKPNKNIVFNNLQFTSEAYYKKYLSLF